MYNYIQNDGESAINGKGFSLNISDFKNAPRTEDGGVDWDKVSYEAVNPKGEVIGSGFNYEDGIDFLENESRKTEKKSEQSSETLTQALLTEPFYYLQEQMKSTLLLMTMTELKAVHDI